MIKRTSREHVLDIIEENHKTWQILDIGCNQDAVKYAQTVADVQDFSSFYKNKGKEFIGGCDIVKEMYESGELTKLLEAKGISFKAKN